MERTFFILEYFVSAGSDLLVDDPLLLIHQHPGTLIVEVT